MKIEDQVCTLEQAKKLYELVESDIDSVFTWGLHIRNEDYSWEVGMDGYKDHGNSNGSYPAYTVSELGEMLNGTHGVFVSSHYNDRQGCWECWECAYSTFEGEDADIVQTHLEEDHDTEAQARAAMLIYLLENNLHTL